ncbi:hypothetical protein [Desulfopila aestuarii]|uniref:Uncharacterized protein n=1 Tax=Desulfopila aestuarii DSM 18488 TaxID=1121416 RepID=A0A1M7YGN7_9BACT|nr:hypothetical protein [Desulfopila aestuarii]SHO51751.1 hypothetical protein SAMN02745220_04208 [Desulfopila aestuarii DSM 18488]
MKTKTIMALIKNPEGRLYEMGYSIAQSYLADAHWDDFELIEQHYLESRWAE